MSARAYRTTGWALCDQAIVSGGNFLTNLILLRTLAPASYGVYALVLNALLFLNNLHASMVAYPVCMRGAHSEDQSLGGVATGGLLATALGLVVNAVLITAACVSIHRPLLIPITLGVALFWQLQETLRTVFVSRLAYKRALAGDAASYLGQAALLALVCWHHVPRLSLVFSIILATSLVAGLMQAVQIRPSKLDVEQLPAFFAELWHRGKWNTLAKIMGFFTLQAFPWLLAYSSGLASVGQFQSLFQIVAFANPLLLSVNNLIVASVARDNAGAQASSPLRLESAYRQMWLTAVVLGLFLGLLASDGHLVMRIALGAHSPYLSQSRLLAPFALAYALEAVSMFAGATLAGIGETRALFSSQLCSMLVAVLLVFPWILHSGVKAAVMGAIAVNATRSAASWYLVIRARNRRRTAIGEGALLQTHAAP